MQPSNFHFWCGQLTGNCHTLYRPSLGWNRFWEDVFFLARFPFDWKNPLGFAIAIGVQHKTFTYLVYIGACVLALGFGCYSYLMAMAECIKQNLCAIRRNIRKSRQKKHLWEQLKEFIEFHSRAKQLRMNCCIKQINLYQIKITMLFNWTPRMVQDFSDVFQHFVLIVFVWSLIEICSAMLQLQTVWFSCIEFRRVSFVSIRLPKFVDPAFQIHNDDNMVLVLLISLQTAYAFGIMYIASELSQRISLAFEDCTKIINQFKWYAYPVDVQRILPIIMSYAQQPVEIQCFGSWTCGRENFKYVSTTNLYAFFETILFVNDLLFRWLRKHSHILQCFDNWTIECKTGQMLGIKTTRDDVIVMCDAMACVDRFIKYSIHQTNKSHFGLSLFLKSILTLNCWCVMGNPYGNFVRLSM